MRSIRNLVLAGALAIAPAFAGTAFASDGGLHPRVVGTGENQDIDYGPGERGNIVGGGALVVEHRDSDTVAVTYLDAQYAQHRTDGRIPVTVGAGEDTSVVYVSPSVRPQPSLAALLRRLGG